MQRRGIPDLRQIVICLLAGFLHYSGLLSLHSWLQRRVFQHRTIVVICLHRVLTASQAAHSLSEPGMILLTQTFESLLQALRKYYRVIRLSDFECLADRDASRPICMITFDDGWRDTFENAYPALRQQQMPAVVFLATNLVGHPGMFWAERFTRLWKENESHPEALLAKLQNAIPAAPIRGLSDAIAGLKTLPAAMREDFICKAEAVQHVAKPDTVDGFMKWEQVSASLEVFEIASHTVTHPLLTYERSGIVERELVDSKRELEMRFKKSITALAYPSGDYDLKVQAAAAEAGYRYAFTTQRRVYSCGGDRLAIPRILLHEGNVTGLAGRFSPALLHFRLMGWH